MKNAKGFLSILQSVDALFPIGAFTLSNGLEDYVVRERICKGSDLSEYLRGFLKVFAYNDLGFASLAYRSAEQQEQILMLDALANAAKTSYEVRMGSIRMCSRFLKARDAMLDCGGALLWYKERITDKKAVGFHPIALGLYGAAAGIAEETLLYLYAYSVISGIVNHAVKLVPLSQMEGQRVLFEVLEELDAVVEDALNMEPDRLGVSGTASEIHSMNHERLQARQYMS
ncbi:MAG: urease accessory protein UreF [Lachnospiraceae bacterium]